MMSSTRLDTTPVQTGIWRSLRFAYGGVRDACELLTTRGRTDFLAPRCRIRSSSFVVQVGGDRSRLPRPTTSSDSVGDEVEAVEVSCACHRVDHLLRFPVVW